jgi:hypothetical protein
MVLSTLMLKKLLLIVSLVLAFVFIDRLVFQPETPVAEGAPPYGESETEVPDLNPYAWILEWKRPEGPPKVALQVGHWKNQEVPLELEKLKTHTGSSGGGKSEWEVNMAIAKEVEKILMEKGVTVELLPATVPPQYWADVFMAIHADGSTDKSISGYKFAYSWRDFTGKADSLVHILNEKYESITNLARDPNITRNMRGYYAFSFWRYEHAIHPMTTAVIAETGFLTNKSDQKLLINTPEIPAKAIAEGILEHLRNEGLL